MPQITNRAEFPVDRQTAFDFLTEPRNWPRFYSNLTALVGDDQAFAARGDVVTFRYSILGRPVTASAVLHDVVPGKRIRTTVSTPGLPDVHQDWRYADTAEGFAIEVTMNTEGATSFLGRVVDRYVIPKALQHDVEKTLENMALMFSIGVPKSEPSLEG